MKSALTIDDNRFEPIRGLIVMSAATLLMPVMDSMAKVLGVFFDFPAAEITLGRFVFQAMLTVPILFLIEGARGFRIDRPLMNIVRGSFVGAGSVLFFASLKFMPLADAIAVFFVEPFILTILSAIFLKEKIGWHRSMSVVMGFFGAVLVIQPSFAVFGVVSLYPLGTATLFAFYLLLSRQLGTSGSALAMQLYAGIGGAGVVLVIMLFGTAAGLRELTFTVPETPVIWLLLASVGLAGLVSHFLATFAFQLAPASLLAPLQYLEIISATLLGLLIFGEAPNALSWLGIVIVVASGIYLFWREQKVARRKPVAIPDKPWQAP
ncbi:DMT family transporter [Consotaella salsifontis]|nr:DMT family transporter [Consotaella salsifontis]